MSDETQGEGRKAGSDVGFVFVNQQKKGENKQGNYTFWLQRVKELTFRQKALILLLRLKLLAR